MADVQQQRMTAPFPAPPPFYQHFTDENVKELRRRRKKKEAGGVPSALELPYLLPPPPPPPDAPFKVFGRHLSLSLPEASLTDPELSHIPKLYPDHPSVLLNPQPYLLSLARTQLTTFLTLIGNLSNDATAWQASTDHLEVLNYNMHDLINQYRPHQARETLILIMEERVRRRRDEIIGIREAREKVIQVVGRLKEGSGDTALGESDKMDVDEKAMQDEAVERRKVRQREAWKLLE